MRQEKILKEAILDLMYELYKEATPSIDFREVYSSPELIANFKYDNYYLDKDRYDEIVSEVRSRRKINGSLKRAFDFQAYLGCGPSTGPVNKAHIPFGLECTTCPYLNKESKCIFYDISTMTKYDELIVDGKKVCGVNITNTLPNNEN